MNVATLETQTSGQDNWDDLDLNDFEFDSIEIIPTKGYLAMPEKAYPFSSAAINIL